ncbi:MAG: alginate export family protein [Nitrospinota bacterium]|nr:alginate export family protein [Nitrospinota bacterium]
MKWTKEKVGWWILLMILTPATTWADDLPLRSDSSFPKPYMYLDKGMGYQKPRFTLNESGLLPDGLSLAVQHRARYETLNSQFRAGTTGSDQVLSLRTLAQATVRLHPSFKVQLEFQDSRAELADSGTAISTGIVNAAELLEGNLQWFAKGLFQEDSRSLLRAGRLTMDIGKRHLVARNRFRNTINAFTGVDCMWKAKNGDTVRAFFTLPVNRRPTSRAELLENDAAFDEETFDRIFWGAYFSTPSLPWGDQGEFYLFGLHENDGTDFATRNRELYTPGFRLYRMKKKGHLDYEWETAIQFGKSRATTAATDTGDLDHFAHFHHVEVGYTFPTAWSPRLILAFDYASGDADPNDGTNGRFDTLFGAVVFDYGPTSIHRPFVHSNITGHGMKLEIRPHNQVFVYIHYRVFWLASDTGLWAGNSGLRDTTGRSGSFLGNQLFVRAKWQVLANVHLESGVAYRIDGDFQKTAPNSPREGNTLYTYIQTTFSF